MAQVKMYSQKDKRFVNFPIACTPSDGKKWNGETFEEIK